MRIVTLSVLAAALTVPAVLPAVTQAMTKSDAVTLANAVNLVASDMPGYTETPPDSTSGGGDDPLSRCAGAVPRKKALADVQSANFGQGDVAQVSSDVQVWPNAALVRKDMKATKSVRARKCLAKYLRKEISGSGVTVRSVKISVLRPAVRSAFGYRIKLTIASAGVVVPIFIDVIVIPEGPVEASLLMLNSSHAPSASEEGTLLNLLGTRLDAALHPNTIP